MSENNKVNGIGESAAKRIKARSMLKKQRIAPRASHKIIAVDDNFAIPQKGETVWQATGVDSRSVYEAVLAMNGLS